MSIFKDIFNENIDHFVYFFDFFRDFSSGFAFLKNDKEKRPSRLPMIVKDQKIE